MNNNNTSTRNVCCSVATDNATSSRDAVTTQDLTIRIVCCTVAYDNASSQDDVIDDSIPRSLAEKIVLSAILFVVILLTVGGNLLVCVTIVTTRKLHTTTNYFVASLAVSDLLLGCLVLPFSAAITVAGGGPTWPLRDVVCNIYVSFDVMLCTASILTLFIISLDRYLSVTRPLHYHQIVSHSGTARRVVALVWLFSLVMSFVPIHLGWNTPSGAVQNTSDPSRCVFELNKPYVLLVSVATYFTPLVVMSAVYVKILQITRRQVKEINGVFAQTEQSKIALNPSSTAALEMRENSKPVASGVPWPSTSGTSDAEVPRGSPGSPRDEDRTPCSVGKRQQRLVSDRKATVTLASVVLAFVVCWIPYFVLFTVKPFLENSETVNVHLDLSALWLGYVNSTINPFLYAFYNSAFRQGFKRVLCGVQRTCHCHPPAL